MPIKKLNCLRFCILDRILCNLVLKIMYLFDGITTLVFGAPLSEKSYISALAVSGLLPILVLKFRITVDQNGQNLYPISDQKGYKTISFRAAHTYIAYIREYPPGNFDQKIPMKILSHYPLVFPSKKIQDPRTFCKTFSHRKEA